ncbi:MAG: hypothetical protein IPP74_15540 [Alphaproteobacteria bacterium]|nr:hypothetical protein [Alphaproteobacteria bacterium]
MKQEKYKVVTIYIGQSSSDSMIERILSEKAEEGYKIVHVAQCDSQIRVIFEMQQLYIPKNGSTNDY